MTDQEINGVIWIHLGATPEQVAAWADYRLALNQFQNAEIKEEEFYRRHLRVDPVPLPCPNYCGSLDLMHEAEEYLDDKSIDVKSLYYDYVALESGWHAKTPAEAKWQSTWNCFRSTARQRAKAFVLTIGKWRHWELPELPVGVVRCQFCLEPSKATEWKKDVCPKCGKKYDEILAMDSETE